MKNLRRIWLVDHSWSNSEDNQLRALFMLIAKCVGQDWCDGGDFED